MKVSLVSIPVQDPIYAHEIYTTKLGFVTKEFDAAASLAIVASAEDPTGVAILLEPCQGNFAEAYQKSAFKADLPVMAFASTNVDEELSRLKNEGVTLRPELDNPEWGIQNVFEDGCGNLLMIEDKSGTT